MYPYTPDGWAIVKIGGDTPHYKVFGSWRGGYTSGDSWRMNSGIKSVKKDGDYFMFYGKSGSVYRCHKDAYGSLSPYASTVLTDYRNKLKGKFKVLKEMPNIMKMDWII